VARYTDREQDRDYRREARELGCTCPATLAAHTHREGCPLVWEPRDRAEYLAFLEEEHRQDEEDRDGV
jgi:hypothetical protein